jgi:hypothetical protein
MRAMCHVSSGQCKCADRGGSADDYDACRIVSRHANAIIATKAREEAEMKKSASEQLANLKSAFVEHDIPFHKTSTIYWDHAGPLITYTAGLLQISSLNPEIHTKWRMSRSEMFMVGVRFIKAALFS